jgi:hypothetical protein
MTAKEDIFFLNFQILSTDRMGTHIAFFPALVLLEE